MPRIISSILRAAGLGAGWTVAVSGAALAVVLLSCGPEHRGEPDDLCVLWLAAWDLCRDANFYKDTPEGCDEAILGPGPAAWLVTDTAAAFEDALHDDEATSAELLALWREYHEARRDCATE